MSKRQKNFWCACGIGYRLESDRNRHCLLRGHQRASEAPARIVRRGRKRRPALDFSRPPRSSEQPNQ